MNTDTYYKWVNVGNIIHKLKKSDTDNILYDSIYMKCPGIANL